MEFYEFDVHDVSRHQFLCSLPNAPHLTLFPPQEKFRNNLELHSCTFVTLFWVSLSKLLDTREHAFVYVSHNTAPIAFLNYVMTP